MPTQVNGIGTTYLGRTKVETYNDVCDSCGNHTTLTNYETKLWFTVVFIPLIPLGKKQVLGECSACRMHRVLDAHEWEKVGQETIQNSAAELAANKDSPEAAIELHGSYITFHKKQEAEQLAQAMLSKYGENVDIQLYLGSWYDFSGRPEDAITCYRKAFAIDPNHPQARRANGLILAEEGRLSEARQTLAPLHPPSEHYDPAVFYSLATTHQSHGEHETALELFQMVLTHSPELAKDREFRKTVKLSEQFLGAESSMVKSDPFYTSKPFLIGSAAVLLLICLFGYNAYVARNRTVHIVNGLPVPITVELDSDQEIKIPPQSYRWATLAEGEHQAVVTRPDDLGPPIDFSLSYGWFERFFRSPAFVLDPTRSGVVLWESAVYRERPVDEGDAEFHVGQPITQYGDIDYVFESFPEEVDLNRGSSVTKTRVSFGSGIGPMIVLFSLPDALGENEAMEYVEKHLRFEDDTDWLLDWYLSKALDQATIDREVEFLGKYLDRSPLDIEWHRTYQSLAPRSSKPIDLVKQYDELLATDPTDSDLLYLRGRIEGSLSRSKPYYDRSFLTNGNNPYTLVARAHERLSLGQFERALSLCDRAIEASPGFSDAKDLRRLALFASRRHDVLEEELRAELVESPLSMDVNRGLTHLLGIKKQQDEIVQLHDDYASGLKQSLGQDTFDLVVSSKLSMLYELRDLKAILQEAQNLKNPTHAKYYSVIAHLELGDLDLAQETLESLDPAIRGDLELCVSIALKEQGDMANAARWKKIATDGMLRETASTKIAAELLTREPSQPPSLKEINDIGLAPDTKAIVLLALAQEAKQDRVPLLDLAEKMNFDRSMPYFFVKQTISDLRRD